MIIIPNIEEFPKMTVKELMEWNKKIENFSEFLKRLLRSKIYNT